jgi:AcrR family transcriptional regulator
MRGTLEVDSDKIGNALNLSLSSLVRCLVMAARRKPASRYHHGALRPALIATAWTFVARHGVDALSLRAVADALGVSHAAPAHHFSGKDKLVDALRVEAWKRFGAALEAAAQQGTERLRSTGRAYVDFALAHPRQMELMFRRGQDTPSSEVVLLAERAWKTLVEAVGLEVGPERASSRGELMTMAVASWAMVYGLAALFGHEVLAPTLPSDEATRRALVERVLEVVIAGLKAPRPANLDSRGRRASPGPRRRS